MRGDKLVADLQRIAANFEYFDKDESDAIDVILNALETAHPEATPEQLRLAVRRAEFQLRRMIADVEGWWSDIDYHIKDPRWDTVERMKGHVQILIEVEANIDAAVGNETDYMLVELHDVIGDRMLVLRPGQRLLDKIALPPLVMIVDRHNVGLEVFNQPSVERVLGIAKIFCVRCMRSGDRGDGRRVRDTAMGMAAGESPIRNSNSVQHLRPAGPVVLLVVCQDDFKNSGGGRFPMPGSEPGGRAVSPRPSSPTAIAGARRKAAWQRRYSWSVAAHHEASHAACALVLGCQVKSIWIGKVLNEKRGGGETRVQSKSGGRLPVFDDATISLAGPAAETLRNISLDGGADDRVDALKALGSDADLFDPLARRAMSIVRRHWDYVCWISAELLGRRRIDGRRRLEQADIEVLMQGLPYQPPDRVTLVKLGPVANTPAARRLLYTLIYPADTEIGPEWAIALAEQHCPNFLAKQRAKFLRATADELRENLPRAVAVRDMSTFDTDIRLIMALCVAADRLVRTAIRPIPSV